MSNVLKAGVDTTAVEILHDEILAFGRMGRNKMGDVGVRGGLESRRCSREVGSRDMRKGSLESKMALERKEVNGWGVRIR